MKPATNQEMIISGTQFKGYIRSFRFFKLPLFRSIPLLG